MCAEFTISVPLRELAASLQASLSESDAAAEQSERIFPHRPAPVIREDTTGRYLERRNFSLVPRWSSERRPKFATHNARLESITTKPTWRAAVLERRCIVPISQFVEPIYTGELQNCMVRFRRTDGGLLYAAAVYDEWEDRSGGEPVRSFAIITQEADPFVAAVGHDRQPLFLDWARAGEWLRPQPLQAGDLPELIERVLLHPDLLVEKDREMRGRKP